jgi:hypothetical protein
VTKYQSGRFHRCDHIGTAVRIDRTEGQCRDQHQCSLSHCPIEDKFADDRPTISIKEAIASWCGGMLLSSLRQE